DPSGHRSDRKIPQRSTSLAVSYGVPSVGPKQRPNILSFFMFGLQVQRVERGHAALECWAVFVSGCLRHGLLFAAQGTGERANEFLTSNPIGHHALERTTDPVLILTNQIGRGLCLAHALRSFQRRMSPDMASLEPAIRKVLHRIENLVLSIPETTHIILKRGGIR